MITIYTTTGNGLEQLDEITDGCWVRVISPEPSELAFLKRLDVPEEFLSHVLDPNERTRAEHTDSSALIVLRYPYAQGLEANIPFITVPLTIIVTKRSLITITAYRTKFLEKFASDNIHDVSTAKQASFVLQILWQIADEYLTYLQEINEAVNKLEERLTGSLSNREVLNLLKYQKSLVYFATGLKSNELIFEWLQEDTPLQPRPEDRALLKDVLIEMHQAIEVAEISENILSQMMDAFASIISNNLNRVMKFLTSVTIVISVPTLIASFYGMNVSLPGEDDPVAFAFIVGVSALISALIILWFGRKDWL